jgi:hypothetical protein
MFVIFFNTIKFKVFCILIRIQKHCPNKNNMHAYINQYVTEK